MTIALVLKILGALIIAGAHRTLVRSAREEGTGWWISTMIVPGAAIYYGLRRFREFAQTLLAMVIGAVITAGGFGLQIYDTVHSATATASMTDNAGEDGPDEDVAVESASATPAPLPAGGSKPLPVDFQRRVDQLQKRYAALIADRAKLDVKKPDAVRAFNLRAADYHAFKRQVEAELAEFYPQR